MTIVNNFSMQVEYDNGLTLANFAKKMSLNLFTKLILDTFGHSSKRKHAPKDDKT